MPDADIFRVLKSEKADRGERRRQQAAEMFEEAKAIAERAGLTLLKHTPVHYSLRSPSGWQINIYPGNRRLHTADKVYLDINANWTLLDVARSAARNLAYVNRWTNDRESRIRSLAYQLWEDAGKPPGDGQQFWYEAEQRI